MDFGGEIDMVAGGDTMRRRGGFSGKRRGGSAGAGGGEGASWRRVGQEGAAGAGNRFSKGRGGSRGAGAAGWGSAKERIDSVTGRENYFSALISAKRTTKVTKGGKTRTAQVCRSSAYAHVVLYTCGQLELWRFKLLAVILFFVAV